MNPTKNDASTTRPRDAEADLQDALQELVSSGEQPDATALEGIVARHPRHATELTDFAVEWALQELLPEPKLEDQGESAVPAAMERFRARIAELEELTPASNQDSTMETRDFPLALEPASDPFVDRTPAELKQVATTLGLDKTLMAKLRDRKVVAETVPDELHFGLAEQLEVPPAAIIAHLAQPAVVYAGASFKASGKPEAGPKETFAEAVRRSFLKASEKDRWLASSAEGAGADEDSSTDTES